MKRKVVCCVVLTYLFLSATGSLATAAKQHLPGYYRGSLNPVGSLWTTSEQYVVGDLRGTQSNDPSYAELRNFFVFNLAGVNLPIESATLVLYLPGSPVGTGYISSDPSETYELHDVITSIDDLINGTGSIATYIDLGDGHVYGSRTITAADMETTVEIELTPAAIADMNSSHALFAFGGKLTTLDDFANEEKIFASTAGFSSMSTVLQLTLIPEPTGLALFSIAAAILGISRCRTRQV